MLTLEKLKRDEFLSKLKKVEDKDWENMKEGTLLFHSRSAKISCADEFSHFSNPYVFYMNPNMEVYSYHKNGWYFYDIDLFDEITEAYKPRLFQYKETLFVSNKRGLQEKLTEILPNVNKVNASIYIDNVEIKEISSVTGFEIILNH